MAVETLYAAQEEAANAMGVDMADLHEIQRPRLVMASTIEVNGEEIHVFRAHSGPTNSGLIAKGGLRIYDGYASIEDAKADVMELATEMRPKTNIRGYGRQFMGGKGLLVMSNRAPLSVREAAIRQYEHRMEESGLAGAYVDVPAGDIGVGADLIDAYADEYHQRNQDVENWQGCITGKSPEYGGADFRPAATGWGTYISQLTLMEAQGLERARTTIQGFGSVGGWHAYFASNDPTGRTPVDAISDAGGILYADAPEGIIVTSEMLQQIANNPDFNASERFQQFHGNKIYALGAMVMANQPGIRLGFRSDAKDIITMPTGYFIPAAVKDVITGDNVMSLGAQHGVIEGGNGTTLPIAHQALVRLGRLVGPDFVVNGTGVDGSIEEWGANVRGEDLPTSVLQPRLAENSRRTVLRTLSAAEQLINRRDLRVGAAAVDIALLFGQERPELGRELGLAA